MVDTIRPYFLTEFGMQKAFAAASDNFYEILGKTILSRQWKKR